MLIVNIFNNNNNSQSCKAPYAKLYRGAKIKVHGYSNKTK